MPGTFQAIGNLIIFRRAAMAQESHNGDHDHSAVSVAVWYDYI